MKWKNKPEQIKTADAISSEVAKTTGVESPYINATVYKEAVVSQLHSLEKEINDMGKETSNSIDKSYKEVNKRIDNLKSGEVVKKEQAVLLLTYTKKEDLDKATEKAMKSSYALFALLNPIRVADAILDASKNFIAGYENILAMVDKLADGDEELTKEVKAGLASNNEVSPSSAYKYINDKLIAFVKPAYRENQTEQTMYVPRIGNSIAVYGIGFRTDSYADYVLDYDVSEILSERGKAVADKYGLDEVLKAYNALDSKVSNVMGNLDKALSLTNNVKKSISESTAIDKDIAIYFKGSMRLMQDLIKFFFDYQKYLVTTVNLVNQNTVNK